MKSPEVRLEIQAQAQVALAEAKLEQQRVSLRMKEVELQQTRLDQENAKKSQDSLSIYYFLSICSYKVTYQVQIDQLSHISVQI